jgi:phosphate transport system permease protein
MAILRLDEPAGGLAPPLNLPDLEKSLRRPRTLLSFLLSGLATILTLLALVPLLSVVYMLVVRGIGRLSVEAFTRSSGEFEGAFGNAILGTVAIVALATLIAVPVGVLGGVFLAEIGPRTRLASLVRLGAKILSGFPSILAGVFVYGVIVIQFGVSAIAGSVALAILMLPTVILTAEEAVRTVPQRIREAAVGMGATPTQVICRVMLPTALPGIVTGVMLAVARAAGETAPLIFTARYSDRWLAGGGNLSLTDPTASLAVFIYNYSSMPTAEQREIAWAAALVLVALVLTTNLLGQSLSRNRIR